MFYHSRDNNYGVPI